MTSATQVYNDNLGISHDAAVGAVYQAGYNDGYAKALLDAQTQIPVLETPPEPVAVVEPEKVEEPAVIPPTEEPPEAVQ